MSGEAARRIVVTDATGNAGTSVVRLLPEDPEVGSVLGPARREEFLQGLQQGAGAATEPLRGRKVA